MQNLSQTEVLRRFNEALAKAGGENGEEKCRAQSVEKLANKGFLGEFLHDQGAKWLTQQEHTDVFIAELGKEGAGVQLKRRNHPVIAYYVPLHLDTNSMGHLKEILEVNRIQEGDLSGL